MARMPRLEIIGVPQHIIQRGNNRQVCFSSKKDVAAYAKWLLDYSQRYGVDLHAWVFMSNHVHLLATPRQNRAISRMMQSLGRQYVRYFNHTHNRSGTLWEGRFRACLVQEENYLMQCYRYIELNPVRAGIVTRPADYGWSSFRCNALGVESKLCTPHDLYLQLGTSPEERQRRYRDLFNESLSDSELQRIRAKLNSGKVLGDSRFKYRVEKTLNLGSE